MSRHDMPDRKTAKKHAFLFDEMAKQLGHDMQQHAIDGDISIDELTDALVRCSRCGEAGDCAKRLSAGQINGETPSYCENKDLFKTL